jgi:hypothetical protein
MSAVLQNLVNQPHKHDFVTDIESDVEPKASLKTLCNVSDLLEMMAALFSSYILAGQTVHQGKRQNKPYQNCMKPCLADTTKFMFAGIDSSPLY